MSSKHNVPEKPREHTADFREQRLQAIRAFQEAWWEERCQEWRERGSLDEPGPIIFSAKFTSPQ
ncbi:hypothetical protein HL670_03682 [Serratia plymuthica]|nr:hypothetical protein HL670_03682 [Serratia plymuthica]